MTCCSLQMSGSCPFRACVWATRTRTASIARVSRSHVIWIVNNQSVLVRTFLSHCFPSGLQDCLNAKPNQGGTLRQKSAPDRCRRNKDVDGVMVGIPLVFPITFHFYMPCKGKKERAHEFQQVRWSMITKNVYIIVSIYKYITIFICIDIYIGLRAGKRSPHVPTVFARLLGNLGKSLNHPFVDWFSLI